MVPDPSWSEPSQRAFAVLLGMSSPPSRSAQSLRSASSRPLPPVRGARDRTATLLVAAGVCVAEPADVAGVGPPRGESGEQLLVEPCQLLQLGRVQRGEHLGKGAHTALLHPRR